ncbi:MAG TPA: TonB family protein, partial [Polyangiaceae bacterium]|nr:TonB family protein [Polyangiaceae bacterium]
ARVETEQTVQDDEHRSSFKGKLPYAAPELYSGATATASTDIYACAVILYQLLAGANPFSGPDAAVIIRRVLALEPAPIDNLRADVPKQLAAVVAKALLKDSQSRFLSAKDFSTALRGILPRSEADIHAEMLTAIRADFSDGLPKLLNVPSLKQLDAAWRAHPIVPESLRVLPSNPTIRVAKDSFTGDAAAPSLSLGRPSTEALAADTRGLLGVAVTPAPRISGRPTIAGYRNLLLVAGALAVAAVATAIAVSRGVASQTQPKYLVVESGDDQKDPPIPDGQPAELVAAQPTPSDAKSHASDNTARPTSENTGRLQTTTVRNESKPPDPSVALSRTFAKRQAAMQQCFQSNAVDVSGTPEVSVRFRIDTDGTVQSASISPTAIGATPLGQCLVQVARSTKFGPQAQPLTFSIPVTTRKR